MKKVVQDMLKIYKPYSSLDWMNYKLVKKNVTFHHIQKRCDGGRLEINNGGLLMPNSHAYLHLIEFLDLDTYLSLNEIFKDVNSQGYEPEYEQRLIIESLLSSFESVHRWDKGSKGKLLVKRKYLERW